jgi:protein-L-isoaspartate O-methyltransferase
MLGVLDLKPGMRVFESGAGCGWTATLMSVITDSDTGGRRRWRYGVDSVEYDPLLAAQAAVNAGRALTRIGRPGWGPSIRSGDGEAGIGGRPSYDATTATHAVRRIPGAWIDQTRPGGLVCAPLAVSDNGLDVFVRLTVRGDGSASGRVKFPLAFMRSRSEPGSAHTAELADDEAREGTTSLDIPAILADEHLWVLHLAIPHLTVTGPTTEDGDDCVWLSLPDGSRAVGYVPQGKPWTDATVEQHGPQDVWTIAEDVWAHWLDAGRPGMDEFGLTVEADGTHKLWMGEPGNVVTVLP